jgi:hypothetical protein
LDSRDARTSFAKREDATYAASQLGVLPIGREEPKCLTTRKLDRSPNGCRGVLRVPRRVGVRSIRKQTRRTLRRPPFRRTVASFRTGIRPVPKLPLCGGLSNTVTTRNRSGESPRPISVADREVGLYNVTDVIDPHGELFTRRR